MSSKCQREERNVNKVYEKKLRDYRKFAEFLSRALSCLEVLGELSYTPKKLFCADASRFHKF